jgi:hypothetical protein
MKKLLYFIIIVLVVAVWLGLNIAYNQPLFSNPFAEKEVAEKVKKPVKEGAQKVERAVDQVIKKTLEE